MGNKMMGKNLSLRARVSLTLFAFAIVVALLVSVVGSFINEKVELSIWEATLSSELDFQLQRIAENPEFIPVNRASLTTYARKLDSQTPPAVPKVFLPLEPGIHDELEFNGRQWCILVRDVDGTRYYLSYDITELEETEKVWAIATLTAIAAIGVIVLLLSLQLSKWLVNPIHNLAAHVTSLNPHDLEVSLAPKYSQFEVRTIAQAIDRFILRLRAFIKRERAFISMASHEFRTPIAVIAGAVDVMDSYSDLPAKYKKPIERIRRSSQDMHEMISALLFIAKEQKTDVLASEKICDIDKIIPPVVESHRHLLRNKDLTLDVGLIEPLAVAAPQALVSIVIGNLIRNAIQYSSRGLVHVELIGGILSVSDTGLGIPSKILQASARAAEDDDYFENENSGLGLYIVRRIASRFDWMFTLESTPEQGSIAVLDFNKTRVKQADAQGSMIKSAVGFN